MNTILYVQNPTLANKLTKSGFKFYNLHSKEKERQFYVFFLDPNKIGELLSPYKNGTDYTFTSRLFF